MYYQIIETGQLLYHMHETYYEAYINGKWVVVNPDNKKPCYTHPGGQIVWASCLKEWLERTDVNNSVALISIYVLSNN